MRILVIGAGGVGSAVAPIAARRSFFEHMVIADYDAARADRVVAAVQRGAHRCLGRVRGRGDVS
jgi:saccharopine dehydrogenase (NAD+, L-lysine-forming)